MARFDIIEKSISLSEPVLVEGLPGIGLVGKIVADHLVNTFEMKHYANVYCEGIPQTVTYQPGQASVVTPVRLYADADRDLLVLQSDVPITPQAAITFANCISGWLTETNVLPIYLSGLPAQKQSEPPTMHGIGIGDGVSQLESAGIDTPAEMGLVSGPTGALLAHALEHHLDAIGLIVESDPQFPDPEAARRVLVDGVGPLASVEIPTGELVDRAEEIRSAREQLAQRMQQADEESTKAHPLRMYQ